MIQSTMHILQHGRGAELVKIDLKKGITYVDRALPFGLRSAPKIFSAVADMIAWALHQSGIQYQIHYIDFLFIGVPATDEGARALAIALRTLEYLGVPVAS
jgi:predicted oxidoreductase